MEVRDLAHRKSLSYLYAKICQDFGVLSVRNPPHIRSHLSPGSSPGLFVSRLFYLYIHIISILPGTLADVRDLSQRTSRLLLRAKFSRDFDGSFGLLVL